MMMALKAMMMIMMNMMMNMMNATACSLCKYLCQSVTGGECDPSPEFPSKAEPLNLS